MEITIARHSTQNARFLQCPLHCDHGRDREYVARSASQPGRVKRLSGSEASQAASQNAYAAEKKPWPPLPVAVVCAGSTLHPPPASVTGRAIPAARPPRAEHTTTARALPRPCLGGPVPFATCFPHPSPPTPFVPVPLFFSSYPPPPVPPPSCRPPPLSGHDLACSACIDLPFVGFY